MKALKHYLVQLGVALLALAVVPLPINPAFADDIWTPLGKRWERYTNERFGTVADVPRHLFELVEPPPANGDGRELKATDGARLWISGSYVPYVITNTFQEYKAWLLEHAKLDRLTYKAEGRGWLVLSGTKQGNIVYRKVVEGCGAAHEVHIEYPEQRKALYAPLVTRVSKSLGCISMTSRPFWQSRGSKASRRP
jgi:hypothetical protein